LDFLDRVSLRAARRVDLDVFALLLVDQRTRDRRGDRDAPLLGVRLGFADDLPDLLLVGVLIDQRDGCAAVRRACLVVVVLTTRRAGGAEVDRVARQFGDTDPSAARELVLELG